MRHLLTLVAALLVAGLAACTAPPVPSPASQISDARYGARHPYYFEFCALSEIQKKPGYGADIRGGVGGHSTIYLNGACLKGAGYPELMVCKDDPAENGVGLSINSHFANANWVAIPGHDFFYDGDLRRGQPLTRAAYDATKAHAKRLGIYDAIRFHDDVFDDMPPGYARDAFKYEVSIGTDYAIGYGRDRYCARIPLAAAEMERMVDYLNSLNRPYRLGEAEYEWNVFTDNCIHVAHNALAAIGFWPTWPTHRSLLISIFDFPVPKNEFVNIMRRANDMPIDDPLSVWADRSARQALLSGERLPRRAGALAVFEPVVHENDIYNTALQLIFYDDPILGSYQDWLQQITTDPRYTSPQVDERVYRELYARIEGNRKPLAWWLESHPELGSQPDFPAFYARFYDAIGRDRSMIATTGDRSMLAASGD